MITHTKTDNVLCGYVFIDELFNDYVLSCYFDTLFYFRGRSWIFIHNEMFLSQKDHLTIKDTFLFFQVQ